MRGIIKYSIILAATLGLIVAGTSSSYATDTSGSDPIFMKISGVTGDSKTKEFPGDIELQSFQFGIQHQIDPATGQSSGRTVFEPIVVTKSMDGTSPKIFTDVAGGTVIPRVDIYFAKTTPSGLLQTYAHYVLTNVIISSYSVSAGVDAPTENLSLNFQKIQFEFSTTNPDGTLASPGVASWDLALNTPS
ncbi:MAG: type VI secretion system tube protein Hcp [Thaumarchaeota archaeon]|nr:type VI secretion system tube protein Hcp [Nitrososphaerota archaeon]